MRIRLEGNLDLGLETWDIKEPEITLGALLKEVGDKHQRNIPFIDPSTDELDELFVISLNGEDCRYLPQRLNTPLRDSDLVEIVVLGLGGG